MKERLDLGDTLNEAIVKIKPRRLLITLGDISIDFWTILQSHLVGLFFFTISRLRRAQCLSAHPVLGQPHEAATNHEKTRGKGRKQKRLRIQTPARARACPRPGYFHACNGALTDTSTGRNAQATNLSTSITLESRPNQKQKPPLNYPTPSAPPPHTPPPSKSPSPTPSPPPPAAPQTAPSPRQR